MSTSRTAEDLMQEMRQIRRELRDDVDGMVDRAHVLVDQAQTMTDWRHYIKNYPLACVGAAALIGYLVIPTRIKYVNKRENELPPQTRQQYVSEPPQAQANSSMVGGLMSMLGGMVATAAMQGLSAIAQQQLDSLLQTSTAATPAPAGAISNTTSKSNHKTKRQEFN